MTEQRNEPDEGDLGRMEYDPEERAEAEVNLEDPSATADEPWSPPDRMPRGSEFVGVETAEGETLDQRVNQEQPEEGTAYGSPDEHGERESEQMVGGDDPDAIPADRDVLGGDAEEERLEGESPEQSAMRVEDEG